jgi:adenylate cyclase
VHTRAAHEVFEVNDRLGYIMVLIFGIADGWKQSLLLLIVWGHGCTGLHFWLRGKAWWRRWQPALVGGAVLVPAFALAGFLVEGRRMKIAFADEETRSLLMASYNFPDQETFRTLIAGTNLALGLFYAVLGVVTIIYLARYVHARRRSVSIRYVDGPDIAAPVGLTLLEMSRTKNVPHASLCGGRGRCTTCRVVIEEGAELLHAPSDAEKRSLAAVGAGPKTRLACQIRPKGPTTVFRVFRPDGRRKRGHASQGAERELALLFLDMRGFTARTTGQLPYDVVFLLNRFFDAIVPALNRAGGTVDKYLGDGFLALFETPTAESSAKAALVAIEGIAQALDQFNADLATEGQKPVAIGIGAHLGDVVLGEIGAAGQAPRTLIGDTVNTASRIEGATKEHQVQALISAPLLEAAGIEVASDRMIALELRGLSAPLLALPVIRADNLMQQLSGEKAAELT